MKIPMFYSLRAVVSAMAAGVALTVAGSAFACATDSTSVGIVKATVVGVEVRSDCAYVLIKDVNTTIGLDTNPFGPGRFYYIALDPALPHYKSMVAIASVAAVQKSRIYAEVVSRFGRANNLSIASEEN